VATSLIEGPVTNWVSRAFWSEERPGKTGGRVASVMVTSFVWLAGTAEHSVREALQGSDGPLGDGGK
jgi:hypothetical protein